MKSKTLKIILVIVMLIIAYIAYTMYSVKKETSKIKIEDVDFSKLRDGSYKGSYSIGVVKVETISTVDAGKINSIKILKHENGLGEKAEIITKQVIENQTLDVDTISGATTSSKVILKSIEESFK